MVAACSGGGSGGEAGGGTSTAAPGDDTTTTADGAAPAIGIDPCALLTVSDLEAATGVAFAAGVYNESLSGDALWICDFVASGTEFATAQVLVVPDGSLESARDGAEGALGGVIDVDVAGASAAFATPEGSIIGMQVGDRYVQVAYLPSGPGDVLAETTQLAAVVAGNL